MKSVLSRQLAEVIEKHAKKDHGFGRIFNHLRRLGISAYISDLALFRFALAELAMLGKLPPKKKINYQFRKKVSKDDYDREFKGEILRDLHDPTPK